MYFGVQRGLYSVGGPGDRTLWEQTKVSFETASFGCQDV